MNKNINDLRKLFPIYSVDGYILNTSDEFRSEWPPEYLRRLEWLIGFTGSNGVCMITQHHAILFTDGRYLLQARLEVPDFVEIVNIADEEYEKFFCLISKARLGFDPKILSTAEYKKYLSLVAKHNIELIPIESNLVDDIWKTKPKPHFGSVFELSIKFCGKSRSEKVQETLQKFSDLADYMLISNQDSICWLLNIRANCIPHTPFLLSYLLLSKQGDIELFSDSIDNTTQFDGIKVLPLKMLSAKYGEICASGQKVALDSQSTGYYFSMQLNPSCLVELQDPCLAAKACKNQNELDGFREAHIEDGVALCKFLCWLEEAVDQGVDEISAAQRLLEFREERKYFQYPSFPTISAYAQNGAVIHYHPSAETNMKIGRDSLYLVDSGGQYLNATTDVTRTLCLGVPTQEQVRNFTLVLKGLINLSNAKFPVSTTGLQLDALARLPLWGYGLNYAHGTGHGVGHFLSVHEGPNRIGTHKVCHVALVPGMITSIEPGFYKESEYGIRIENLAIVKESIYPNFLEFETITMAPIDKKLIDYSLLTSQESEWLNKYHKRVYDLISPHLTALERDWLERRTSTVNPVLK